MKTLFVVSDVHSFYDEMIKSLTDKGFDIDNKDHIFVSCGDLLDRGPNAVKCLRFVNNLPDNRKILIRGNHEDLLQDAIYKGFFQAHDYHNRTNDTVYQLTGIRPGNDKSIMDAHSAAILSMKFNKDWNNYIDSCINYYETKDYIFVHGWIPSLNKLVDSESNITGIPVVKNLPIYDEYWRDDFSDWKEARWSNGMYMWSEGVREPNKTIVCGHFHSSWGHCNLHNNGVEFSETTSGVQSIHTPFYDDGIIALDSCVVYSGFVNCLKLEVEDE